MRQVPRYLLIGDGRVARHFQHYFTLLQLSFVCWHRKQSVTQLEQKLHDSSHVLILISDKAIEEFIATYLKDTKAFLIHFSGSVITDSAYGAHPLSSFSSSLWDVSQYQAIPFILDEDAPLFETLLPGLSNQHVRLAKSLKPKYHALCVLSGNFSCLLWQKLFATFEQDFHIPKTMARPYLQQIIQNLLAHPESALTGPLVRNDQTTIAKNIEALANDPFHDVYLSFVKCYEAIQGNQKRSSYE